MGLEVLTHDHMIGSSGTSPHPEVFQELTKNCLISTKDAPVVRKFQEMLEICVRYAYHSRNYKVPKSSVSRSQGQRTNIKTKNCIGSQCKRVLESVCQEPGAGQRPNRYFLYHNITFLLLFLAVS
jgi:hypothetical protein